MDENNKRYNEIMERMDDHKCKIDELEFEAICSGEGRGPDTSLHVSEIKYLCGQLSLIQAVVFACQYENLLNVWRQEIMLATRLLHATRYAVILDVAGYVDAQQLNNARQY